MGTKSSRPKDSKYSSVFVSHTTVCKLIIIRNETVLELVYHSHSVHKHKVTSRTGQTTNPTMSLQLPMILQTVHLAVSGYRALLPLTQSLKNS